MATEAKMREVNPDTITGLGRAQVRQICYRCSVGDPVWPPDSQHSQFSHGVVCAHSNYT